MMGRKERHFAPLINVSVEQLVPQDHFYRHLERTLDLSFVREFVEKTYAGGGRPSIDPVVFFKLQLVMFFEDIRSERLLMRHAAGKELHYFAAHSTERSRRYRAHAKDCNHCPLKAQCTTGKQGRSLCRSVDENTLDRVRAYQSTEPYKKALRKRQVWVEPLFAEAKDWHGMRRFRLRRLWRVNCEALMRAAGQNLKRLLKNRGWGRRPFPVEAVCACFLTVSGWLTCSSLSSGVGC